MNSKLARVTWKDPVPNQEKGGERERKKSTDPGYNIDEPWKHDANVGHNSYRPVNVALRVEVGKLKKFKMSLHHMAQGRPELMSSPQLPPLPPIKNSLALRRQKQRFL